MATDAHSAVDTGKVEAPVTGVAPALSRPYRASLTAVLTGLAALTLAGPARAEDPREEIPTPNPVVLAAFDPSTGTGYCAGFDAVVTFPAYNQYVVRQTTAADGTTTLKITGHAKATVTNQSSGKSVTLNISGPGTIVIEPDGAFRIDAAGPNLLWTSSENSFGDVPEISYTRGRVSLRVDASGQTTSYTLAGGARQTDVCVLLAT